MRKRYPLHTKQSATRSKLGLKAITLSGAVLLAGTLGGCESAGEGLFTGAALGAVAGLVIGSMNGEAGEGAALGAVIGGVGGSIIGDQNAQRRRNSQYHSHRHRDDCDRGYRNDEWWND